MSVFNSLCGGAGGNRINGIERGTFHYADYFPNSNKLQIFSSKGSATTLLEYMNAYIVNGVKRNLALSTIEGYEKCRNAFKKLHPIPIGELTSNDILHYIEQATVKTKTLTNRLSFMRAAMARAVVEGTIQVNPLDGIKVRLYVAQDEKISTRGKHEDVDIFTMKELKAILANCRDGEREIVEFWVNTGVRSSEWAALQWQDVDLVNEKVHVVEALVKKVIKATKTKAGNRYIDLNESGRNALVRQKAKTLLQGTYVFLNDQGKPWIHESFRKHRWTRILKEAGVRYRYPYQLRHTYATRHISAGMNIWKLAKLMGHSNPEMLFKHYGSYIEEYANEEENKNNKLLGI
jgi:integrase